MKPAYLLAALLLLAAPAQAVSILAPTLVMEDHIDGRVIHTETITDLRLLLDNQVVGDDSGLNAASISFTIPNVASGQHILVAEITDSTGASHTAQLSISSINMTGIIAAQLDAKLAPIYAELDRLGDQSDATRSAANNATLAAQQAVGLANAIKVAVLNVSVPDDVARSHELENLLSAASFNVWSQSADEKRAAQTAAMAESHKGLDSGITSLDTSSGLVNGMLMVTLALVGFYLFRLRREVRMNTDDRLVMRAVFHKLGIGEDDDAYKAALKEVQATPAAGPGLIHRLRAAIAPSPTPAVPQSAPAATSAAKPRTDTAGQEG